MDHEQTEKTKKHQDHNHPNMVHLKVDGKEMEVPEGEYRVADLKALLGVPAEYEFEIVEDGQFRPLDDNAELKIKEHADFVSHVRCGASS
jgi:sulfur carrier protein ThiS